MHGDTPTPAAKLVVSPEPAWLCAIHFVTTVLVAVRKRGRAVVALAGGSTPRVLYERLAELRATLVPWHAVDVLFGDERCVPPDDAASNARMARAALLDRVPVDPARVHAVDTALPPAAAAAAYAATVARVLGEGGRLDLALLGLGEDGHTASLFPGGAGLAPGDPLAVAARSPVAPHDRVTLSLRALEGARDVAFLVVGAGKAAALAALLAAHRSPVTAATPPAARLRAAPGRRVTLFADHAALPDA